MELKTTWWTVGDDADESIATITLSRPRRHNAWTGRMHTELRHLLQRAEDDSSIRVVIITADTDGRAFCPGADAQALEGHAERGGYDAGTPADIATPGYGTADEFDADFAYLWGMNTITIAAVNGVAVQTGLSLALACDFRIGAESARLTSGTLRFGLLPDEGGHKLMVQHMGVTKAMEFCMRKQFVGAEEGVELGMLNEVVPDDQLEERTMALATELANGPQVAMRLLKRTMYNADEMTWDQACDDIATKTALSDWDPDAKEGGLSFKEKRQPVFNQELGKARGAQPWTSPGE